MMTIIKADTERQYSAARELIIAYQTWLGIDLEYQSFSKELDSLSVMYGPPHGAMFLAKIDEISVGCAGLRRFPNGNAEMKRMFVLPAHQG